MQQYSQNIKISKFVRECQTVFQRNYTNLYSHQQDKSVSITFYGCYCQHTCISQSQSCAVFLIYICISPLQMKQRIFFCLLSMWTLICDFLVQFFCPFSTGFYIFLIDIQEFFRCSVYYFFGHYMQCYYLFIS